jgi:hypothetical protein
MPNTYYPDADGGTTAIQNYNPTVIDVTSQEEVVIKIPYHAPTRYVLAESGSSAGGTHTCYLGNLVFSVPVNLNATSSTSLDDIIVDPYISYHGIEFAGPRTVDSAFEKDVVDCRVAEGQMSMKVAEAFLSQGINWIENEAVKYATKETFDAAADYVKQWWNGSTHGVKEEATRIMKMSPFPDDASFGNFPETKTLEDCKSTIPRSLDGFDFHSFQKLIQTPSLMYAGTLTTSLLQLYVHPRFPKGVPTETKASVQACIGNGYMTYMSQFFRHYRGSIKYHIKFVTNAFISTRARISYAYGDQATALLSSYSPNVPTRLITIKGVTDVSFSVPSLQVYEWIGMDSAGWTQFSPRLSMQLTSAIASDGDRTAECQMFIWWAAGEDFQFRNLYSIGATEETSIPVAQGQCDIWKEFEKPFSDFSGVCPQTYSSHTDQPKNVEDLLTRWSSCMPMTEASFNFRTGSSMFGSPSADALSYPRVGAVHNQSLFEITTLFDSIANLYLWNTGSICWKVSIPPDYAAENYEVCVGKITSELYDATYKIMPNPTVPDTGNICMDPSTWKSMDFSTPLISNIDWDTWAAYSADISSLPYGFVQEYAMSIVKEGVTDILPSVVWKRASPDFRISTLLPLPCPEDWPIVARTPAVLSTNRMLKKRKITRAAASHELFRVTAGPPSEKQSKSTDPVLKTPSAKERDLKRSSVRVAGSRP